MLAKHYTEVSNRQATAEVIRSVKAMLKADALRQKEARKMWAKAKAGK